MNVKERVFNAIQELGRARGLSIFDKLDSATSFDTINACVAELEREGRVETWMGDHDGREVPGKSPILWSRVVELKEDEVKG